MDICRTQLLPGNAWKNNGKDKENTFTLGVGDEGVEGGTQL